jgi:hypothetical protein
MMLPDHVLGLRFLAETAAPSQSRAPALNARTVTLSVPASRETVFHFLADIENLPRWASGFCERLEISAGRWVALTSFGDLVLEMVADSRAGAIDLQAGEDAGHMDRLFSVRVHEGPDGGARVSFALVPRPGCDGECHERHLREFLLDLRGLLVRFGGGDLQAPAQRSPEERWSDRRRDAEPTDLQDTGDQRALNRSWFGLDASLFERLRWGPENRARRNLKTSFR